MIIILIYSGFISPHSNLNRYKKNKLLFEQSLIGIQFEITNNETTNTQNDLKSKEYEVQVNFVFE